MNAVGFRELLTAVSQAWNEADTNRALTYFTEDAIYMEPPDRHYFRGHAELKMLFDTLCPGDNMKWHGSWFDAETQSGAGEFTFGTNQTHGVAIIELDEDQIKLWREYQWHGLMPWADFINPEHKMFEYTVGRLDQ